MAGATATPLIPLITHDKIGRGTMKWMMNGKAYSATEFIRVYGEGDYFNLWGRTGSFTTATEVGDIELVLPKQNEFGKVFASVGTYLLGGAGRVTPFGDYYYYGSNPALFTRYATPNTGNPTGRAVLMRYDAERGMAAGTCVFDANWHSGTTVPGAPSQVAITQGEFDITF